MLSFRWKNLRKELEAIGAVISLAALMGCATTAANMQQFVQNVITITKQIEPIGCQFAPIVATVIDFYNAQVGAGVQQIAAQICAAVAQVPPVPAAAGKLRLNAPVMASINGKQIIVHGVWIGGPNAGHSI